MSLFSDADLQSIDPKQKGEAEKSAGQMSQEECSKVITIIKEKMKFDNNIEPFAAIAGLCQVGATSRKAGKNISYVYKGKLVSAADLQKACFDAKKNSTPRQFARTMGTEIAKFATILSEPGDLSRQMKLDNPLITLEEEISCSNFKSANGDCPETVREWLRENF